MKTGAGAGVAADGTLLPSDSKPFALRHPLRALGRTTDRPWGGDLVAVVGPGGNARTSPCLERSKGHGSTPDPEGSGRRGPAAQRGSLAARARARSRSAPAARCRAARRPPGGIAAGCASPRRRASGCGLPRRLRSPSSPRPPSPTRSRDWATTTRRLIPASTVSLSFAGSQDLVAQLQHAAPADVLRHGRHGQHGRRRGSRRRPHGLRPQSAGDRRGAREPSSNLVARRPSPKPGLKVVLAAPEVPAGKYAQRGARQRRRRGRTGLAGGERQGRGHEGLARRGRRGHRVRDRRHRRERGDRRSRHPRRRQRVAELSSSPRSRESDASRGRPSVRRPRPLDSRASRCWRASGSCRRSSRDAVEPTEPGGITAA